MKLIKPSYEIIPQEAGLEGIYKAIELAGRTCYKSEDKITPTSAEEFVNRMIKSGHHAMLEFGTVYLIAKTKEYVEYVDSRGNVIYENPLAEYKDNPYSKVGIDNRENYCVSTNYRVLVENGWLDDLRYLCEPTEFHEKRVTVHFTTQIAITREYNRHRVNSMAEQSTRYCNYGKDKFGGVGINLPSWVDSEIQRLEDVTKNVLPTFEQLKEEYFSVSDQGITKDDWGDIEWWLWSNLVAEESYLKLIEKGRKPQEARVVLPLDTNTELIHTAFVSDWNHFFRLRSRIAETGKPHPQAQELADPLMDEFIKRGYIN